MCVGQINYSLEQAGNVPLSAEVWHADDGAHR